MRGRWQTDRRDAGGVLPDPYPLHLDEPAVSHRQRLVRRIPAGDLVLDRRGSGQHLQRPVVPDHHCRDDFCCRHAVRQGNQGRGHLRQRLNVCFRASRPVQGTRARPG